MEGLGIADRTREAVLNEGRAYLMALLHCQIGFQLSVKCTFDLVAYDDDNLAIILFGPPTRLGGL